MKECQLGFPGQVCQPSCSIQDPQHRLGCSSVLENLPVPHPGVLTFPSPLSTKLHGRSPQTSGQTCSPPELVSPAVSPALPALLLLPGPLWCCPTFPQETGSSLRIRRHCLSTDSCNKVPQTHWLQTTDMHSLTVLEARSPKSWCPQGHLLFRCSR